MPSGYRTVTMQSKEEATKALCSFSHCLSWQGMPISQQYQLLFVLRGNGRLMDDTEKSLSQGTLCLVAPGNRVVVEWSAEGCELYTVRFSPLALTEEGVSSLTTLCKRFYYEPQAPQAVEECLKRIREAEQMGEAEKKLLAKLALTELLMHLQIASSQSRENLQSQPLSVRVKQYLDENLTLPHSLDDLAKRFFVSKYYLCRSFKSDFGVSVHHYLSHCRVELACKLIARGETASAAAYHVGFGDYSSFYRSYKKHKGQAPSDRTKLAPNEERRER